MQAVANGSTGGTKCNAAYCSHVRMQGPNPTTNMRRVEFKLSEDVIEQLDQIAHDLSEPGPGGTVTRADVLREASVNFTTDFDPASDELSVGKIGNGDQEDVEA